MKKYHEKFNKIKIPILFFAVFYAILLTLGSTLSWMVSSDNVTNEFKTKEIEIEESNFHVALIDEFEIYPPFPPGGSEWKRVTVENTGTMNAFVRILVIPTIVSQFGEPLEARIGMGLGFEIELIGLNVQDWKSGDDNYYYYLGVLEPEQIANDLFYAVQLTQWLNPNYEEAKFDVHVKSEAIAAGPSSYRDAWWQGDIPTDGPLKEIDDILQSKAN